MDLNQATLDTIRRSPDEIVDEAISRYKPIAIFAGLSGGNGSRPAVHWAMNNVPGCEVVHINTGIGIEKTREWVRDTCAAFGWPLREIRALEDCGQDYDEIVRNNGFPGPNGHMFMYRLLKERCVRKLVRQAKAKKFGDGNVMIMTGVRHADSIIRTGYAGREINKIGSQIWVNHTYWWTNEDRDAYDSASGMPRNPYADALGMSGECGCGAYAHPGELARWESIDPSFGERIRRLEGECLSRGFTWGWEGRPPKGGRNQKQGEMFAPLCINCIKSAVVQAEMNHDGGA